VLNAAVHHELSSWIGSLLTWKTPIKLVFFCTVDFAIPLWYLIAMAETYIVWLLIVKKGWQNGAVKLIPLLLAIQVALRTVCETMELAWFWKINCFTSALPWFLLGYYFHSDKGKRYLEFHPVKYAAAALLGLTIMIAPAAFDLPIKFNCIGVIPFSVSLFLLAVKYPDIRVNGVLEYIGSKLSLNIYIFHLLINKSMTQILRAAGISWADRAVFPWLRPFIVLLLSIIVAYLIELLKERSKTLKKILP
jgi:surface polysaccharide O-acyltransferase-like enzyme